MSPTAQLVQEMSRLGWLSSAFNAGLASQVGLAPTDLECLTLLRNNGATTAGDVAEALGLTTGAVTGVVDRLEKAGYVSRRADPADRRRVVVEAIPDRLQELNRLYEPLVESASAELAGYSAADLGIISDYQRRTSRILEQEVVRLRAEALQRARGGRSDREDFSAALEAARSGRLEFANGTSRVAIHAGSAPAELYHASVEGLHPDVQVRDGVVVFRYRRVGVFDWRRHIADVALNPGIPWTLNLSGGASKVTIDARHLRLAGLCLQGGASELTIVLGPADGATRLEIGGGLSRAQIVRPDDVPVELRVRGGASRLELDGQRFGAIGGDVRLASPGFELATDRYSIEIAGGASRLTIETNHNLEDQPS